MREGKVRHVRASRFYWYDKINMCTKTIFYRSRQVRNLFVTLRSLSDAYIGDNIFVCKIAVEVFSPVIVCSISSKFVRVEVYDFVNPKPKL